MRISPRAFGSIKEALAKDKLAEAVGAAQVPQTYSVPKSKGGRDLTEDEAARIAGLVGAGRALLLLLGDDREMLHRNMERVVVIDALFQSIRRARSRGRKMRWDFDKGICRAVAIVAVQEFVESACKTCFGAGQVRLNADAEGRQAMLTCQSCLGTGLNRWKPSERAYNLGSQVGMDADAMLKHQRWRDIIDCLDWAKSKLSESIRHAVEETAFQLEIT